MARAKGGASGSKAKSSAALPQSKAKTKTKTKTKAMITSAKAKRPTLKDPSGGLTAAGRKAYKASAGLNLKPGVKKALEDMTPDEMRRKGSFLRRHYATPRGPLVDDDGKPTRLALQAHAWGEPVPKTPEAARKLAEKGEALLKRYKKSKDQTASATKPKAGAKPKVKAATGSKVKTKTKSGTSAPSKPKGS